MLDNDKKNENENEKKDKKNFREYSMTQMWLYFFILLIFSNVFFNVSTSDISNGKNKNIFTDEFISQIETSNFSNVTDSSIFTCVKYIPVYEKDGTKNYEVKFKYDKGSGYEYFNIIVPASEIDEKGNIEIDAQYEGDIVYLYVENAYTEKVKDLEGTEKDNRIISLINSKSEYAGFGCISEIDFMYSEYLDEYTSEKANEKLTDYVDSIVNPEEDKEKDKKD